MNQDGEQHIFSDFVGFIFLLNILVKAAVTFSDHSSSTSTATVLTI